MRFTEEEYESFIIQQGMEAPWHCLEPRAASVTDDSGLAINTANHELISILVHIADSLPPLSSLILHS